MRQHIDELLSRHRPAREHGVVAALGSLCRTATEELNLLGATVTLMPSVGVHAVSAASAEAARLLEEAQFSVGEGPTREAFSTRRPVLVADLRLSGPARWPGWTRTALDARVSAAYAFPLYVGASIFGVISLYGGSESRLGAQGLQTALVFSEIATELLLDGSAPRDGQGLDPDLDATLGGNAFIYQAQGMVMVELGVSLPEALTRMRAHAWATNQDLATLAEAIVDGRAMPPRDHP